jgi:CubicO group peptidase (beta-lactamase class C family)
MKALAGNHLLSPETMQRMQTDRGQLGWAMYYGYGLMQFTFLMMPDKYDIWGHSGSIGSFAYYNPGADVFLIGSYHKLALHSKPIFFINKALRRINKEL